MLSVVAVSGVISAIVGGHLLWKHLAQDAQDRMQEDLNAAREFYNGRAKEMEASLRYTALGERFAEAVRKKDTAYLAPRLDAVRRSANMDLLSVTDGEGRVILRAHKPDFAGDSLAEEPLIRLALGGRDVVSGTLLVPLEALKREWPALAERARISVVPTPRAGPPEEEVLSRGMTLCAAAAVRDAQGELVGVLRASTLLNRNQYLVDHVQNTVFRDERYRGKLLGAVTIFQSDVRISTTYRTEDGLRGFGTRASSGVYETVVGRGEPWIGSAWVVEEPYITAYSPIKDINGKAVGMLGIGVLERKFRDAAWNTIGAFAMVVIGALGAGALVAWRLASSISRPVARLVEASSAVAHGDFAQTLPVGSADEIGALAQTFNTMARSLKERDELLKEQTRQHLTRSERLASIGRLAAGVAHEINNPLTGVLTFSHMVLKSLPDGSQEKEDVETIIEASTRCRDIVRGLLNFSRQNKPERTLSDLNDVLREALNLTRNQASMNRVNIVEELNESLRHLVIDPNQIEEVAVNLIVNAIDAMPDGGDLTVHTRSVQEDGAAWTLFEISDSGCGIPASDLEHIFDPFFTTKETGKGTGLGLAISYGIVAEHGGKIAVSSEVDRGTTVTVRLPNTTEGEP